MRPKISLKDPDGVTIDSLTPSEKLISMGLFNLGKLSHAELMERVCSFESTLPFLNSSNDGRPRVFVANINKKLAKCNSRYRIFNIHSYGYECGILEGKEE